MPPYATVDQSLPEHDVFTMNLEETMDWEISESSSSLPTVDVSLDFGDSSDTIETRKTSCIRRPLTPSKAEPRCVSFDEQVNVRFVDRIADILSEDYVMDLSEIWVTAEEMRDSKLRTQEMVRCLENGIAFQDKEDCIRGIEHKLAEPKRRRRQIRTEAIGTVLLEQAQQVSEGQSDPDSLAMFYAEVVTQSQTAAYQRAAQDRLDIVWL